MEASTSSSSNNNNNNNNSELFICFTSRLSSSMKLSSASTNSGKSLLSPGRAQISLSTSLSRRLRTSASLKSAASSAVGQASPMFPSGKKRSGCASAFDNPEPSSPKVTCIGQVRVKTKSKKKRAAAAAAIARSRSSHHHRRSLPSSAGEASFRKKDEDNNSNNNSKWICGTLRTFGSELNCFLSPCWSSNNNNKREDDHRRAAEKSGRSCGAVFGRWLVAVQDGGDGKGRRREIELVVSAEKENNNIDNNIEDNGGGGEVVERSGSLKRRVFEGIEFRELEAKVAAEDAAAAAAASGTEEKGRVSLCVPPKNALLLMRCRSDPVKMAALASRFWESPSAADLPPPAAGEDDSVSEEEPENNTVCEEAENNNNNEAEVLEKIEQVFDVMEAVVLEEEEEDDLVHESSTDQEKVLEESDDEEIGLKLLFDEYEEEEKQLEEEDCLQTEAENKKVKVDQLPDCLLLMMCEPKLSMEVSKETWVCTTDFVRWLPDRRRPPPNPKKIPSNSKPQPKPPATADDSNPAKVVLLQPPRSSCSAMTAAKLAGSKPYEPFVLTRCKSEPVKSAAAVKLAAAAVPESCLWKNRKLEPHHHRLGLGGAAAGVGF